METQTKQSGMVSQPGVVEDNLRRIEEFLKEIIRLSRLQLTVSIRKAPCEGELRDGPEWIIDFAGRDQDMLLEAHAELLDALGYIASKAVRLDEDLYRRIAFDCQNYRKIRRRARRGLWETLRPASDERHGPAINSSGPEGPAGRANGKSRHRCHSTHCDLPYLQEFMSNPYRPAGFAPAHLSLFDD